MTVCALCRLPIKTIGRLISAHDNARQNFVFPICAPCTTRLNRLPLKLQRRQMDIAIRTLASDPGRFGVRIFPDAHTADLYCKLEAEHLRGEF